MKPESPEAPSPKPQTLNSKSSTSLMLRVFYAMLPASRVLSPERTSRSAFRRRKEAIEKYVELVIKCNKALGLGGFEA